MHQILDLFLHLDQHLNQWVSYFGPWMYVVLFLIIFCETGLVVTPFLPGDSLLFALGALTAMQNPALDIVYLGVLLSIAAVIGDAVNYGIGRYASDVVLTGRLSRFVNRAHLDRAAHFYKDHGGKTIVLARFMPIIRTFAPFVAGMAKMEYRRFAFYNVMGALVWIWGFLVLGFQFGNIPAVKDRFHIVIFAIIALSFAPLVIEMVRHRLKTPQSR